MTDQVFDRAQLAEAVGNDIADMAHFWMPRKFQFLALVVHAVNDEY